jgi:hypothetical protein
VTAHRVPRALTTADWIKVWMDAPGEPQDVSGGRYTGMYIAGDGKIYITYVRCRDRGLDYSVYLGWVTRIELSDEESVSRLPEWPDDLMPGLSDDR